MQTVSIDGPEQAVIAEKVHKAKRIVVVSGAGISCSAGIPDFRSKDGLYNLVKHAHPDAVVKGQDLFDASLFRSTKAIGVFFTFIAELRARIEAAEPTPAHHFMRRLGAQNKLLRIYTQNIDGYEARVGLKDKTVMLHGDIHSLRCTDCKHVQGWSESDKGALASGKAPSCIACKSRNNSRRSSGLRKRPTGLLRPHIVLYNEHHPDGDSIGGRVAADVQLKPDMLLVLGTSLKVDGIKGLVRDVSRAVQSNGGMCVFVNATPLQSAWRDVFDFHVQSGIDEWVGDLKLRKPQLWQTQMRLDLGGKRKKQEPKRRGVKRVKAEAINPAVTTTLRPLAHPLPIHLVPTLPALEPPILVSPVLANTAPNLSI